MRAVGRRSVPCGRCAVRFAAGGAARRAMMDLEHEISQHATRLREPLVRRMEGIWGLGKVATWMVSMWLCCTVLVQDVWRKPGPESVSRGGRCTWELRGLWVLCWWDDGCAACSRRCDREWCGCAGWLVPVIFKGGSPQLPCTTELCDSSSRCPPSRKMRSPSRIASVARAF